MNKKGNYNKNRNRSQSNTYKNQKNDKVVDATETGFTGTTEEWFSDAEFYKNLPGNQDEFGKKDYYFNSYSSFYIHEEMIKDKVRTGSYRAAIENNAAQFKDKIVLDIGCGTSILSIFAARAGAKHVYAIEFADIADYAREIVKKNQLSDKITIIKAKVEEAELPVDTVDIIISEWMGYFLIYESMLDTVLFARDKWLRKDGEGLILPDRATLSIATIEDSQYKSNKMDFWNGVGYGIDMNIIKDVAIKEPLIDVCEKQAINSTACKVLDIDLYTCQVKDLDFSSRYNVTFTRQDQVNGTIVWFDIFFDKLARKVEFTTSPYRMATHWKQVIFYTQNDINVEKGETMEGSIAVRKSHSNPRALDIKVSHHFKGQAGAWDFTQQYKIR